MSFRSLLHRLNHRDQRLFPKFNPTVITMMVVAFLIAASTIYHLNTLIHAQSNPVLENQAAQQTGGNMESWHSDSVDTTLIKTSRVLSGDIPDFTQPPPQGMYLPGGAIGTLNGVIAQAYTPPASGIVYLASLKDNFLGVKTAYAQGSGFGWNGLQPLLPMWKGFRNLIYLITSLAFILMGVMIMLRIKISPQAVISIQNSIPQIITTLLLVTFSYAICGLLIDLSYVLQGAVLAILFNAKGIGLNQDLISGLLPSPISGHTSTFADLSSAGMYKTFDLLRRALPLATINILGMVLGSITFGLIGAAIGAGAASGPAALAGVLLGIPLGYIILNIILDIMIIFWLITFFFGLVKCYLTVILKIILAPIEIGLGALPNSKTGFNTWIMDFIAHLAVFPGSILFLVIVDVLISNSTYSLWRPTILGSGGDFLDTLSSANGGFASVAIGLAAVMLLSKLPEMIPQFIFMLKPSPWEQAIGQSMDMSKSKEMLVNTGKQAVHNAANKRYSTQENLKPHSADRRARAGKLFADVMELSGQAKPSR